MKNDKTTHILERLEIGFRTDSARLKVLEKDLTATLQCARQFAKKNGSPDDWSTNWQEQWDNVAGILSRIREHVNEMDGSIESDDRDRLKNALGAWETIQSEDAKLVGALSAMRAQAIELDAGVRKDWNILAHALESHLATIHACAQALRIKLELLKKHSKEEVDLLVRDILSKLPNRTQADEMGVENYEQEYRKAAAELEQEHHKFLGFVDVLKALSMWIENTEERTSKNLSLKVDQDELARSSTEPGLAVPLNLTPLNPGHSRNDQEGEVYVAKR